MTSDDFESSAHKAAERGAATASDAADQAQGLAGQVSGVAGDLYGRAKEQVEGLADRIPGSASDAYAASQRAYAQGSDQLGRQIARQPIEALLLAGAIGYLVGWATSRA